MLELLLKDIREALKGYTPKWDVDYTFYDNGREVDFEFSTTLPDDQGFVALSIPYEEGDNLSHVGIKIMERLNDFEGKNPEDEAIEALAWHINQSH